MCNAEYIPLEETGYGSGQHSVVVLTGETKAAVRRQIAERNYRAHNGDRPGQVYAYGCKALRWLQGDSKTWQAVCISSSYWDV